MSSDTRAGQLAATNGDDAPGVEAAEHERPFRETLEFCPAGLCVIDEDGQLLFHNARLRLRYREDIVDGIENCPGAIAGLYRVENLGKRLIGIHR